jgi:hypothetical protein
VFSDLQLKPGVDLFCVFEKKNHFKTFRDTGIRLVVNRKCPAVRSEASAAHGCRIGTQAESTTMLRSRPWRIGGGAAVALALGNANCCLLECWALPEGETGKVALRVRPPARPP